MKDAKRLIEVLSILIVYNTSCICQDIFTSKNNYSAGETIQFLVIRDEYDISREVRIYSSKGFYLLKLSIDSIFEIQFHNSGEYNIAFQFSDSTGSIFKTIEKKVIIPEIRSEISSIWQNCIAAILGALISFISTMLLLNQQIRREDIENLNYFNSKLSSAIDSFISIIDGHSIVLPEWFNENDSQKVKALNRNKVFMEKYNSVLSIINNYNSKPYSSKDDTLNQLIKLKNTK